MDEDFEEIVISSEPGKEQIVPLVYYKGKERVVLGRGVVKDGIITVELNDNVPEDVRRLVVDRVTTSYSVAEVFNKDTPLFPANAYQVNEPLAEARLIDAVLGIKEFNITKEGETSG